MNKYLILSLIFCFFFVDLSAQILNQGEAKRELEQRGLDEEVFRQKMLERGFDLDNIDPNQLPQIEQAMEEVVREMDKEMERAEEKEIAIQKDSIDTEEKVEEIKEETAEEIVKDKSDLSAERIKQAVEDGIPLEEAIANELSRSTKEELPPSKIYGQHIFRNKDIAIFTPAEDVRPPDTYVLGPGDKITVLIWGKSQENATFTVDKAGAIYPERMPKITLKGLSYQQAKALLESRYQEYFNFKSENFEVTIDYSRTITVNILGEAMESGSFNVPATNTAFNALAAAGGPSDIGSVRKIKLLHPGGTSKQVDIYKMMLDPSVVNDFFLENNDYIFIPVAEKLVEVEGAVRRPYIYELIQGEGLKKLIYYAGGFNENAIQSNIQIRRYENDEEVIVDVDFRALEKSGGDFELLKGDKVMVQEIEQDLDKFVEVVGAVKLPGQFQFVKGMKLKDLVRKAQLTEGASRELAFIQRKNLDGTVKWIKVNIGDDFLNIDLQAKDRLVIYEQSRFVDEQNFVIDGSVRQAGEQPFDASQEIKVADAIIMAGGTMPEATDFAYIFRRDPKTRNLQEYVRVDLKEAINNPSSSSNIVIQPFDSLVVYDYKSYMDNSFIVVDGAVRKERKVIYDPSLTLRDALVLSGGLRMEASLSRVEISRVNFDDEKGGSTQVEILEINDDYMLKSGSNYFLKPFDIINVRRAPDFELQRNIVLKGEVKYSGKYSITKNNEKISDVIERAGGLSEQAFAAGATLYRIKDGVGYVVMALDEVMLNKASKHNYILKDGDIIEIPKKKDFVSIRGASKAKEIYPDKILKTGQINVPHHKGKTAKWYVDHFAAGVGEDGRRRLITVEHPNGRIEKTNDYGLFKKYPRVEKGSIITVGKVEEKELLKDEERKDVDWGKVFADAITQATSILALILLIESAN